MTGHVDTERILAAFLAPEHDQLAERVLEASLADIARTPQRRAPRAPWRFTMVAFSRAAALVAVLVLAIGGVVATGVLAPTSAPSTASPPPSSSNPAVPPGTTFDPASLRSFNSPAFGYSAALPVGWRSTFGTSPNSLNGFTGPEQLDMFSRFDGSDRLSAFAWSIALPANVTPDAWIATYLAAVDTTEPPCFPQPETWTAITVDGQQGWTYPGCHGWQEAMVIVSGRAYVFATSVTDQPETSASTLRALLATVRLHPENALGGDATLTPFRSVDHAYTVQIPSTWVARPATEPWAAGTRIGRNQANADRFTPGVTIGDSAYITAQVVDPGTSLDTWLAGWLGTREELDGFCSYSGTDWEQVTVNGIAAAQWPLRCSGAGFDTPSWDQYTLVAGGRAYVIAGTPSMVEHLVSTFQPT